MPKHFNKFAALIVCVVLAAGTAAIYWQVRNFDFISYDDNLYVYENPQVLNGITRDGIIWAFTTGHAANWHPLTWLSLMLDCKLFGTNSGLMHVTNLLLHLINSLLLFLILRRMTGSLWPSAFVAAGFAIHPMHVESVAWIAERKDVLSTFFFLLTIAAYVGYVKKPGLIRYLLALLAFVCGLLAKPMLVTVPFVLLLLDYWPLKRFIVPAPDQTREHKNRRPISVPLKQIIIEKIPFLVLAAISSIITYLVQQSADVVIGSNALGLTHRIANASVSYIRYIVKFFWPQNLAIFYPFNNAGYPLWQTVSCIFLLLFISVLVIRFAKKSEYLPVGWFWFMGTLVPVIGLIKVGEQSIADRYTYIPYIGLLMIIAWGIPQLISRWHYRKIALYISVPIIFISLGIVAHRQAGYWKNTGSLFSHALEITQDNYVAYFSLGDYLYKKGNNVQAEQYLRNAIAIFPDYTDAILSLGCVLADQNDFAGAISYFEKTIELRPDSIQAAYAHENMGTVFRKQNRHLDAAFHFTRAVQLKPDFAKARFDLADSLLLQGRLDEAVENLRAAIQVEPNWIAPINNLAFLIASHPELKYRDPNEAIDLAQRACGLSNYQNPVILGTLSTAYAAAGKFSEAIETVKKAINLAQSANQPQVKQRLEFLMSLYTQRKPLIETSKSRPVSP